MVDVTFGAVEDAVEETYRQICQSGWDTSEHDNVRRCCPDVAALVNRYPAESCAPGLALIGNRRARPAPEQRIEHLVGSLT